MHHHYPHYPMEYHDIFMDVGLQYPIFTYFQANPYIQVAQFPSRLFLHSACAGGFIAKLDGWVRLWHGPAVYWTSSVFAPTYGGTKSRAVQ